MLAQWIPSCTCKISNDLPLINDDIEVLKSRNYENDFLVIMNLLLY